MQNLPSGAGKSLLNRIKKKNDSEQFHTASEMWAQREVTKGKTERRPWKESEDLWCLSPPVRGSLLWQARKYFSNLSPCWHRRVIDTNMPAPLKPPLSSTFTALLLFKHAVRDGAHLQWWKRGKKVKRKRDMSPGLWGCPWLWKICTFLSPHLRLESTVSRKHGS